MHDDIPTILRDAAADPQHTPDFEVLAARGRRRRLAARSATTLVAVVTLVSGGVLLWPGAQPLGGPVIGDGPTTETSTTPSADASPEPPTPGDLRAEFDPAFAGLPTPDGDGSVIDTISRVKGLGAFVSPREPLPLHPPYAAQKAPEDATLTVVIRSGATNEVLDEIVVDELSGGRFDGPSTGPTGTRYVLEATLRVGDRTVDSWIDVAVVTNMTVNVDIALTSTPRVDQRVTYVLVNRGRAGVVHGGGYQLDRLVDGSWVEIQSPLSTAEGNPLAPAALSDPMSTSDPLPAPGRYRLTTAVSAGPTGESAEQSRVVVEFSAPG